MEVRGVRLSWLSYSGKTRVPTSPQQPGCGWWRDEPMGAPLEPQVVGQRWAQEGVATPVVVMGGEGGGV